MTVHFSRIVTVAFLVLLAALSTGCASDGAMGPREVQAARARVTKVRDAQKYPFALKPTGDATLDAIVGTMVQVANEKVENMEKVVAAGSSNLFDTVNARMEEEFAKQNIADPTAEQRAQVRAKVSAGLTADDRKALAEACEKYEDAAGAYRRDEKKNAEVIAKCAADLAAKAAALKGSGAKAGAGIALGLFGGGEDESPIGKAQAQADYASEVIRDCDFVIKANESRATDSLAMMNLGGRK